MKKLLTLLAACVITSCSKQESTNNVIPPEQFEKIYVELLDSTAVSKESESDTTLTPVAERILKRNNVTEAEFRATVQFYNADTKRWKEFYENVTRVYTERRTPKKE